MAPIEDNAGAAESSAVQPPSLLERLVRLPEELQAGIFAQLSYQDALRLSQVNRYFHLKVEPEKCPEWEKAQFVFKAQFWEKHNMCVAERMKGPWGRGVVVRLTENNYACYRCYRVRPRTKFSLQMTKNFCAKETEKTFLSLIYRYCIDCGLADGKYRPGMTLSVTTDEIRDCRGNRDGAKPIITCKKLPLIVCRVCKEISPYEIHLHARRCRECLNGTARWMANCRHEDVKRGLAKVKCLNCEAIQLVLDPGLACKHQCFEHARMCRKDWKDQQRHQKQMSKRERKAFGPGEELLEDDGEGLADVAWL
ncbi:hypothetical protein CLAFUW4_08995 [Fulvia fulva]|nr:hypothetical protein CLAFUR4_09001 [Fulvia fulva]KAK4614623.1 hypothetical protein CLAFUR0_08993 [Fulvia fulva]WPV20062.1 hypothetical protein CLAFUW4_08995 [Fulvia fulva]WPV35256.1 hypothetical protein CLAFUW7_08996 [Fulvia fulva]